MGTGDNNATSLPIPMIPPRSIYHCRRHQPRLIYGSLARYSLPASAHGDITDEMRLEDRSSKATSGRGRQRRDSSHETRSTCKPRPWPRQRMARPLHPQHCSPPPSVLVIAKATMIPARVREPALVFPHHRVGALLRTIQYITKSKASRLAHTSSRQLRLPPC